MRRPDDFTGAMTWDMAVPHTETRTALGYLFRALFVMAVLAGGAIFWLAPYPPMGDLPQHAGQVALLHDLLQHQSPWAGLVRLNLFNPYLIGYGSATLLSFVMPVVIALKLELTLTYFGFVAACVFTRRRLGGSAALDWLFVPSFFGFCYEYGFFTFVISAPLAILWIELARTYARAPAMRRGLQLLAGGIGLFFCHGLIFVFAAAIGGIYLLWHQRHQLSRLLAALWPYLLLGLLCVVYVLLHRNVDLREMYRVDVIWEIDWQRPLRFLSVPWGISVNLLAALPAGYLMLAGPLIMRQRLQRNAEAYIPFLMVVLIWAFVPHFAMNTAFLFERFSLFTFPFYALIFTERRLVGPNARVDRWRLYVGQAMLALICFGFLSLQAWRAHAFAVESADFETVLDAASPGQRALGIIADSHSAVTSNPIAYDNFTAWYQTIKQGFADFNFAWAPPQIVRFQQDKLPAVTPMTGNRFTWTKDQSWIYRYFFIRSTTPPPAAWLHNPDCTVALVKSAGLWSLYENLGCRTLHAPQ